MAVHLKFANSKDRSNGKGVQVHFHRVTQSNLTGSAKLIGADRGPHKNSFSHEFTYGGKKREVVVLAGDVLFRTGENKRWQIARSADFKKRFPGVKL